ncbi:unnamed protein product [Owenia fusiformis]|uniref:Uncharacterized protein n=1 Tax=Owenia fusiformis TaxID=6347 RepID=A0A8S4NQR7_OWEFU|nr:unnamed protein product [Owenia fusiformis]
MMISFGIKVFIVVHLAVFVQCQTELTIAGLFTEVSNTSSTFRQAIVHAAAIAIDDVNNKGDLLPGYTLKLQYKSTQGFVGPALNSLFEYLYAPDLKTGNASIMVLGPFYSNPSLATADVTSSAAWGVVQVSMGATSPRLSNNRRYPLFFRTCGTDSAFNPLRLKLLNDFNWRKVAMISQLTEPLITVGNQMNDLMSSNGTRVLTTETFDKDMTNVMNEIQASNARILLSNLFSFAQTRAYCEAYHRGMYGPKFLWISVGPEFKTVDENLGQTNCTKEQIFRSSNGSLLLFYLNKEVNVDNTDSGRTLDSFHTELIKRMNGADYRDKFRDYYVKETYDAAWSIGKALHASQQSILPKKLEEFKYKDPSMSSKFAEAFKNLHFKGLSGPVSFENNGDRIGRLQIDQLVDGVRKPVGIYDEKTKAINWLVTQKELWEPKGGRQPLDGDLSRVEIVGIDKALRYVFAFFAAMNIILATILVVFEWTYRGSRVDRYTMPVMNGLLAFGAVILNIAVIVQGFDMTLLKNRHNYLQTCQLGLWFTAMGFTMFYASMVVTMYVTYKHHRDRTPPKVKFDWRPVGVYGILNLVVIFILVLWKVTDTFVLKEEQLDEKYDDATQTITHYNTQYCTSSRAIYWQVALAFFEGLLIFSGTFFAWPAILSARGSFTDVHFLAIAVFVILLLTMIGGPVMLLLNSTPSIEYGTTAAFILTGVALTLCILIASKIVTKRQREKASAPVEPLSVIVRDLPQMGARTNDAMEELQSAEADAGVGSTLELVDNDAITLQRNTLQFKD